MKKLLLVFAILGFLAPRAEAQAGPTAPEHKAFVDAVERCDTTVLKMTCGEYVAAFKVRFGSTLKVEMNDPKALAGYFGRLDALPCPLLGPGLPQGKLCLYDDLVKTWITSLDGGLAPFPPEAAKAVQTGPVVTHWSTREACEAATSAPFYRPDVAREKPLAPGEAIFPHPTGGCVEMALPKELGGRGWVRIEKDRPFVFNERSGRELRLAECDNDVYEVVPFEDPCDLERADTKSQPIRDSVLRVSGKIEHSFTDPVRVTGGVELSQPASKTGHRWYSPKRASGKIFWGAVGVGVGVGTYCLVSGDCVVNRVTQTVILGGQ